MFCCKTLIKLLMSVSIILGSSCYAKQDVYFGTGSVSGDGIYHSVLDKKTGKLSEPVLVAKIKEPSFLANHPTLNVLYAAATIDKTPVVAAYSKLTNGKLALLNHVEIGDGSGAHIAVHPSGRFLLTAQYGGGSVAVFALAADGKVIKRSQLIEHTGGSKVVKDRQNSPHPHWVGFSPDAKFAFVPDLGLDAVMIYRVADNAAELIGHGQADTIAGGGPRHMRFSKNGQFIYLLNELDLSISTFTYDAQTGQTKREFVVPTLGKAIKEQEDFNSASEILVHPTGKYVYSANRGHDSVSVFASDESTGSLRLLETEHVRGAFPRNINMDPEGKWLLAAGQHSNTVAVFKIEQTTGLLQYRTNSTVNVPEPTCILFD
ncbi:lactonase family protein [Pseudoalteromonas sp. MEBiC 03485]|uniref:lactonase family protein n=1 Tax=Pseudoalteromonas sp. MEBiC 03485 TaxID=2571103 RepID=UPI00101FA6E8|nr:lactonase family protein [Pseudoalteromonas sp. MEBiC 03485]RZD22106.1 lactonase family protein [Pseudoalteromonas sp. MEBiC 03485]